ncbi:MAG: 16S rRNA processing protein RimM [Bacteroides sp.]|nr:16S rRNA processing protein RimM [Bacteroides sp.]
MNGEIIFPKKDELVVAGRLLKPHGIKGEISAGVEIDDLDLREVKCVVVEIEGIPVPFFPTAVRPKNHASVLVTLDGVTNESEAAELCNKDFYILPSDVPEGYDEPEGDGFYAADLIGFEVSDADGKPMGRIADIEDSTQNVLFIIETPRGGTIYVPVADEFILDIDPDSKHITLDPPEGISELND